MKMQQDDLPPINAESKMGVRRTLKVIMMGLAFVALIGLGFLSLQEYQKPRNLKDIPLIEADKTAFKVKPKDPGGMEIPNKNKQVYNAISTTGGDVSTALEISRNVAPVVAEPAEPVQLPIHTEQEKVLEQVSQALQVDQNTVVQEEAPVPVVLQTPEPQRSAAPAQNVVKKPAQKSLVGQFVVQLGSFRSKDGANKGWAAMTADFPKELESLTHEIREVKLGSKGKFYRVFAGPMINREAALSLCKKLTEKQQGCLVSSL